jgi:hypothetical protein
MLKHIGAEAGLSRGRWLVSVAITVALLVAAVGVAQAAPPTPASGTFTQTAITDLDLGFAGPNVIINQTTEGSLSGTLTGTFQDRFRVIIHPDGRFTAQGTTVCACTVDGRSGVVELRVVDTGQIISPTTAVFAGHAVITATDGELSGLQGVFEIEGTVDITTGLSTITYTGQIHLRP